MTTTTGILAGWVSRGDVLDIDGQPKTVSDIPMLMACRTRLRFTFTDGTTYTTTPQRYVTIHR